MPCQPCCSTVTNPQPTAELGLSPLPSKPCLSQLPPSPFCAWFGSCYPLLHQRDLFLPRGCAVGVCAAFLLWISSWKLRQQLGDSCACPSFICLPWLWTVFQYQTLLQLLSRCSADSLSYIPPKKEGFHTQTSLERKTFFLYPFQTQTHERLWPSESRAPSPEPLIWGYSKNQHQTRSWITPSPQPPCKYRHVPQDTARSRGTQGEPVNQHLNLLGLWGGWAELINVTDVRKQYRQLLHLQWHKAGTQQPCKYLFCSGLLLNHCPCLLCSSLPSPGYLSTLSVSHCLLTSMIKIQTDICLSHACLGACFPGFAWESEPQLVKKIWRKTAVTY